MKGLKPNYTLDVSEGGAQSADTNESEVVDHFAIAKIALNALDADFILYAGEIQFGHEDDMYRVLSDIKNPAKEVILWLTTPGGNPDAAYSMARLLQRKYDTFTIYVNGWCKSSGTLMCLGSSKLIMGDLAQLGPLDIQILNREEFGERHSGLNPIEALRGISYQSIEVLRQQFLDMRFGGGLSTRQALDVATNLTGQLMSPITSQLDIMKYGEFTRSLRIANEYGSRLAKYQQTSNVRSEAINLLTTGYPSHGFVIDREEASEKLFSNVGEPGWELLAITQALQAVVDKHMGSANNRALLVDLRHALGVSFAEPVDEPPLNEVNSSDEPRPNTVADDQSQADEAVQDDDVIELSGIKESEHGPDENDEPAIAHKEDGV